MPGTREASRLKDSGPVAVAAGQALLLRVFGDDPPATLLVAAHPDDETIGASVALARLGPRVTVVYATDGAPEDGVDARACGYTRTADYAAARLREATAALAIAGVGRPLSGLGIRDQEAAHRLVHLMHAIDALIAHAAPELILTHAFEGGHPDHDAVAFATHAAARPRGVVIAEFTGYHAGPGGIETGCFADPGAAVLEHALSETERARKAAMIACFATQRHLLEGFGMEREAYRVAPDYNFAQPPCGGAAYYDRFAWGLRSTVWPALVRAAHAVLDREQCSAF
jgi:LmbE family N-acetylglucosaminyl deacetylase